MSIIPPCRAEFWQIMDSLSGQTRVLTRRNRTTARLAQFHYDESREEAELVVRNAHRVAPNAHLLTISQLALFAVPIQDFCLSRNNELPLVSPRHESSGTKRRDRLPA